jgi:4-amino-4-deoxy-L-arabinose transferase-like glycosyltransferase
MITTELRLPELGLIAATRGMLGAGIGLLLADRLDRQQRESVGWTLLAIGVLSTLPLAMIVLGGRRRVQADRRSAT